MQKFLLSSGMLLMLSACQPAPQVAANVSAAATTASNGALLTSKAPYQPQQDWRSYSAVPVGFSAVGLQHVARHGSRFLSSQGDDILLLALLQQATDAGALTPLGQQLAVVVNRLHQAHQPNNYGEISALGVQEHRQMAQRLLARLPQLFEQAVAQQRRIAVLHSGRERADQSGDAFVAGLTEAMPALKPLFDTPQADERTLYFYKAEGSEAFARYRDEDPRLLSAMQQLAADPSRQQAALSMLARFFQPEFLNRLQQGEIELTLPDDDDAIRNPLDAANVLFSLYSIASNLTLEGPFDFSELLLEEHLQPLAELDDADSFYGRGPAFAGDDITYRLAGRLVADMLDKAEQPNGYVASFRFTHAQVLMPLAAFLGIAGASEPLPQSVLYSYKNSPWRSAKVSPMAANVQWEVYRNADNLTLIRMLHHEQETAFGGTCQPYTGSRFFYTSSELRRCLLP